MELRKARRAGDLEKADLISQSLDDGDVLELVSLAAEAEYDYSRGDIRGEFGDQIRDFLEFFKDFLPQIMEIIATIIQVLAIFAAENDEEEDED